MINEDPIVYKPGAYKTPGVYKGAGGIYNGRGIYNDGGGSVFPYYYTLYENFDFSTKIDYPIVGEPTQYETSNNYSYSSENLIYNGDSYNALKLKNTLNTPASFNISLKLNSYVEFICKIGMVSSSAPAFIRTESSGIGFYVDLNKGNKIGIVANTDASNYATKNGAYLDSVGYGNSWFETPLQNNKVFKFRIDYLSDKVICSVDGVEYVVFNKINSVDVKFKMDPRTNNTITITDIKCYLA